MKKWLVVAAGLSSLSLAQAADLPRKAPVPLQAWNWTGFYAGAHIGAGWSRSVLDSGDNPVIYGNNVLTPSAQGGGQIGYNWQAPGSAWVVGAEAALSALGADGSNTCFATSGALISASCRVRQSMMASATGRLGYAMGHGGRTLLYAKAGGAWLDESIDISTRVADTDARLGRFGWIVGAGVEQALTPAWSMTLEYNYADFGRVGVDVPRTQYAPIPGIDDYRDLPGGISSASQTMQSVRIGLNLKLGADVGARWDAVAPRPLGLPVKAMAASQAPGTEVEVGGRVWYSFGRFQEDLAAYGLQQDPLLSRLTYNSKATSGELFGRIDTASNVVIKGFVGGGKINNGNMYDEDWMIAEGQVPYSATLSDTMTGSIAYVTADIGYDFIRDDAGKFSAFIGYNYMRDDKLAKGCAQLAGTAICNPTIPSTVSLISETDDWHSLRLGINGVLPLTERLKLTADAAYLPYVRYHGVDNHMIRTDVYSTVSPADGTGQGVQLEAVLSYAITPSFNVGAGARYWAMWATGSDAITNDFSKPGAYSALPVRTDRYGGFLQASYTFDSAR